MMIDVALHIVLFWKPAHILLSQPPTINTNPLEFISPSFKTERILFFVRLGTMAFIRLFQVIWMIVGSASLATQRYMV